MMRNWKFPARPSRWRRNMRLRIPITHFDFYRLSGPEEARELGIEEAAEAGICLVEWPERAAGLLPQRASGWF